MDEAEIGARTVYYAKIVQFLEDNFYREVNERPMLEHLLDELASKQQESIGNSIELPRINQKPFRDVIH